MPGTREPGAPAITSAPDLPDTQAAIDAAMKLDSPSAGQERLRQIAQAVGS